MPSRDSFCAQGGEAITASDSGLGYTARGLSFGGAGSIRVTFKNGDVVTIPDGALAAGIIHPMQVTTVWSTGTTATDIVVYK